MIKPLTATCSLTAVMFDISLELSFGESLNTVATPDRNHPWIELVKSSVKLVSVYTGMRRLVPRALWTSMNRLMLLGPAKSRLDAYSFAKQAFERRLKNTTAHKDFMAHMIEYAKLTSYVERIALIGQVHWYTRWLESWRG